MSFVLLTFVESQMPEVAEEADDLQDRVFGGDLEEKAQRMVRACVSAEEMPAGHDSQEQARALMLPPQSWLGRWDAPSSAREAPLCRNFGQSVDSKRKSWPRCPK